MYHDVKDSYESSTPFCVSTSRFREQMRVLADDYNVISLEDGLECLANGNALPPRSIAITFDDGYKGVLEDAVQVLEEFRLPATVFLRCDVLKDGFEPDDVGGQRVYLTWREVEILLEKGLAIGAHTISHRTLARIPPEEMQHEIMGSKGQIEGTVGARVRMFAYPYGTGGDFNSCAMRYVKEAGFRTAFTAVNGSNSFRTPVYALKRTKVEGHDSLPSFRRLLRGGMDPWAIIDKFAPALRPRRI